MKDIYKQLGFKRPDYMENTYGIRIYIGTEGKDDWCVEIPKEICDAASKKYKYGKNIMHYLVTEEQALEIATQYTEVARKRR